MFVHGRLYCVGTFQICFVWWRFDLCELRFANLIWLFVRLMNMDSRFVLLNRDTKGANLSCEFTNLVVAWWDAKLSRWRMLWLCIFQQGRTMELAMVGDVGSWSLNDDSEALMRVMICKVVFFWKKRFEGDGENEFIWVWMWSLCCFYLRDLELMAECIWE